MDEYKKGLQQRLADHEQELKSGSKPSAGGSSKLLQSCPAMLLAAHAVELQMADLMLSLPSALHHAT